MSDELMRILISAVGAVVSGVASYIIAGVRARMVTAEETGRHKAEFEHLKKTVEVQNEILHERVTKMSQAMTATLEKLDARTIEIIEKQAELRGIMLGLSEKQ